MNYVLAIYTFRPDLNKEKWPLVEFIRRGESAILLKSKSSVELFEAACSTLYIDPKSEAASELSKDIVPEFDLHIFRPQDASIAYSVHRASGGQVDIRDVRGKQSVLGSLENIFKSLGTVDARLLSEIERI